MDAGGKKLRVEGRATLGREERQWTFVPAQPWRAGAHQVAVQTTIEDLAGNNIGKAFDVDIFDGAPRQLEADAVSVLFTVR
jgi:hypothetical protein